MFWSSAAKDLPAMRIMHVENNTMTVHDSIIVGCNYLSQWNILTMKRIASAQYLGHALHARTSTLSVLSSTSSTIHEAKRCTVCQLQQNAFPICSELWSLRAVVLGRLPFKRPVCDCRASEMHKQGIMSQPATGLLLTVTNLAAAARMPAWSLELRDPA